MRKSLHVARCLSSLLSGETGNCVLSSSVVRTFHPVSEEESISTIKLTRRFYEAYLSVPREEPESQTLPRNSWSASKGRVQDTLLSFPGFLSADEKKEQLFISDTNHHRVIIIDGTGKILDCIGSSPGFENGTFEQARLHYPSSTVFDEHHDCLYIADSKNHVIRRADMSKRTIDTVGRSMDVDESPVWGRFSRWMQCLALATKTDNNQQLKEDTDGAENNAVLSNPYHMKLASDGSLLVASLGFESLWVLQPKSGQCFKLPYEGSRAVYEEFTRSDVSKEAFEVLSLIHPTAKQADIVSRVAYVHNNFFYIDIEGHIVRKMDLQTGRTSTLQLSNFGRLGLPAWWSIHPLSLLDVDRESGSTAQSKREEEMFCHHIQVQAGRCLLCINPVLPEGMTWAAPVEDHSVWRQARGSVVELSTFGGRLRSHKVSGAQQWVDDFEEFETEFERFDELVGPQQSENGLPLYCFIDATLGSGEVLVDAVLYLKPNNSRSTQLSSEGSATERESNGEKINSSSEEKPDTQKDERKDREDLLCLTNLHVRVKIEVTDTASGDQTHVISVQL